MLLEGKHDYAALDIKQGLLNSCTNKICIFKYYSGNTWVWHFSVKERLVM